MIVGITGNLSRFQKPSAAFFWSKQSEAVMMCSLRQSCQLTRLVLPLCNDLLLKAISVYCRKLKELEITLSLDASEEGLLALAGVSVMRTDQGAHRHWNNALHLHKVGSVSKLSWSAVSAKFFLVIRISGPVKNGTSKTR